MSSFKKVTTIDGQPIFRGEHNNVRGYYTFEHYKGMGDLLDNVFEHLDFTEDSEDDGTVINVAVIGKPNAGMFIRLCCIVFCY